jgi:hypothetical protein
LSFGVEGFDARGGVENTVLDDDSEPAGPGMLLHVLDVHARGTCVLGLELTLAERR